MYCEECKKHSATVHLTKIVNGDKVEARLCEQCARENGELSSIFGSGFSLQHLLSGLLQGDAKPAGPAPARCECGMTYEGFAKSGRLGCHKCYDVFADSLRPMLRRIHGSGKHMGKVPSGACGQPRVIRDIDELREDLRMLVIQENYEEAAKVRDRIRELGRDQA